MTESILQISINCAKNNKQNYIAIYAKQNSLDAVKEWRSQAK